MPFDLSGETIGKIIIWGVVLSFSVPFGYYYGVSYWGSGAAGALLGLVLGLVATGIGLFVKNKIANLFGALAGERKASFSSREQYESDIQQIRYHKMRKDYEIALRKVNEILELDPEYPEVLFLKAQIVWEGFGNNVAAVSNLEKIQMIVGEKQSTIYRWSDSLIEEIKKSCNRQ